MQSIEFFGLNMELHYENYEFLNYELIMNIFLDT